MKYLITNIVQTFMQKMYYFIVYTILFNLLFPDYGLRFAICINIFILLALNRLNIKDVYIDKTKELTNKVLPILIIFILIIFRLTNNIINK